jgi:RimJ/RimL family protein N-acetyltransferase
MMLRPGQIELREPFPEEAWPLVWGWTQSFRDQITDDSSPTNLDQFVEHQIAKSLRMRIWAVYRGSAVGDELGGMIAAEPISPCAVSAHFIFKKSFWGSKTTIPACNQAIEHLFADDRGTLKISGLVFSHNHAVRGILTRLGFAVEGIFRDHTLQQGKPASVTVFGLTKKEWKEQHELAIRKQHEHQQHDGEHVQRPATGAPELTAVVA